MHMYMYMYIKLDPLPPYLSIGDNVDSSTTQLCRFTTPDLHCRYVYYIALSSDSDGITYVDVEPDRGNLSITCAIKSR